MIVLGIDPGLATTGYALVAYSDSEPPDLFRYGVVRTPAEMPMPVRLQMVHGAIVDVISESHPDEMAIEELFFKRNVTTALTVGQARGVLLLAAAQARLAVFEYKPAQIKQSVVGYGGATKRQMQEMVKLTFGLASVPRPDDAADAVAVAICHLYTDRLRRLIN